MQAGSRSRSGRGPERNPWATSVGRTLVRLGHVEPPDPAAPGMFALADRDLLERLVRDAGFASLHLEEVGLLGEDPSFEEYWASVLDMSMNARTAIEALSDEQAAEVRDAVRQGSSRTGTARATACPA